MYATLDEFKLRMGTAIYAQLTDLSGGTSASDTVGAARLADAHGMVNSLLGARFQTPVNTAVDETLAEMLRSIVCSYAAWQCYIKHPLKSGKMREAVEADYREAKDLLTRIVDGKASLPGLVALESPTVSGPTSEVFGEDRIFDQGSMSGF